MTSPGSGGGTASPLLPRPGPFIKLPATMACTSGASTLVPTRSAARSHGPQHRYPGPPRLQGEGGAGGGSLAQDFTTTLSLGPTKPALILLCTLGTLLLACSAPTGQLPSPDQLKLLSYLLESAKTLYEDYVSV